MAEENNKPIEKSERVLAEEKVLEFWRENKIFEKSVEEKKGRKEFVFYEGPPTANAKPALHHLEARAFKDAIPRYKTMQGFHVRRKGGWDTHGLPVELQVEKKLGLNSKKAIEDFGIAKFNKECKDSVWEHVGDWSKFTERIGYWVDRDNPYVTYDNSYIESVWNILKKVNEQKLLYKDYKVVPWCPRCGTALSSHELAQGYEDVKDLSIYVKFRISPDQKNLAALPASGLRHGLDFPGSATYILAWTTTPWTLPGNVALAVGEDIDYVRAKTGEEFLILAESKLSLLGEGYEVVENFKGKDLIGLEYEPLFPYLKEQIEKKGESTEKAFRIYGADFVTTEDGTGVVHTAVMYGQDDFVLGNKVGLPKHHLVNPEGLFVEDTGFLEGRFVKEVNEDGKPTLAVDIIEELKKRNLFFKQENYKHSYPHCWRCKTALIYYARDSWYIRMSDPTVKNELINENKSINWEPEHTRDGRFGEWLREIKDWAISRERYWGTPLPVWESEDGDIEVIGSIQDLSARVDKGNKYFMARHGEADKNLLNIVNSDNTNPSPLTLKGRENVDNTAEILKKEKIDFIFVSPLLRTQETAEILAEKLGVAKENIITDDRLKEIQTGEFNGRPIQEYRGYFSDFKERFTKAPKGGENFMDVKDRVGELLYEVDSMYANKNILFVSHEDVLWMLSGVATGLNTDECLSMWGQRDEFIHTGEVRPFVFKFLPHNENYELDLHRPYIDQIVFIKDGKKYKRVKEVMDVWFDSGAMPFAQDHYPFENKEWVDGPGYPADYISEAIDQTRGWFYTLHAIGILMGRGKAFKNVICLGHLLDAKGKKMSKSVGNIVDPWQMIEKYGVDTLRVWMYSVNQPGESKNFDEKTVLELSRQVFGLLYNVLAFYELYRDKSLEDQNNSDPKNILDKWILARLNELVKLSTDNLDNYKLLEPTRAMKDFIGDLSTWYLRRSRDRIKDGDVEAKRTLYFVLTTLASLMAPFAPFSAEDIWQKLRHNQNEESVHLSQWPESVGSDSGVLADMILVREIVSLGLDARQRGKIQVRQPLRELKVKSGILSKEYIELIEDELNVKKVVFDGSISGEVELGLEITEELKSEGNYRELVRAVQNLRKKMGLTPSDRIKLSVYTSQAGQDLVQGFMEDMKKSVMASSIEFTPNEGEEIEIEDLDFKIKIEK